LDPSTSKRLFRKLRERCEKLFAPTALSLTGSDGAQTYFSGHPVIGLGAIAPKTPIEIEYFLGYNFGTSAVPADGFGFTTTS
jgi:hypothetical protein